MIRRFCAFLLRVWGWRVSGEYPHHLDKIVLAAAPHTSNWDFPVGVLINTALNLRANYVGKSTLFRWPFGRMFRALGGIPVDRSKRNNFVQATVHAFARERRLHLVIAPEGARKRVERFKTGFYHIARLAQTPILLITFDWQSREVRFGELFYPTGDEQRDLAYIWDYFKGVQGKRPEYGLGANPYKS